MKSSSIRNQIPLRFARLAAVLATLGIPATAVATHECNHRSAISCNATVSGALSTADCVAPDGSFYDFWEFSGTSGQSVTITMTSSAIDTYLVLLDPFNSAVAQDDDSGGGTNSQLTFTLNATGTWIIVANSLDADEFGNYNLSLVCAGAPPPTAGNVSYIQIAGRQPGANNTSFISDVRILNSTGTAATVTLDFFPLNSNGVAGPSGTSNLTVAALEQAVLNDVVLTRFNTTGLGVIRVSSTEALIVISRIINDQRPINQGTTGFAFRAKTLAEAKTSGTLPFLSSASAVDQAASIGFRTNLGYFNPNTGTATVTFTARRTQDGSALGSDTVTIPARASQLAPIFNIIASVPASDRVQTDYYVTYEATAPIFIYASITDNKTGDGVLVE